MLELNFAGSGLVPAGHDDHVLGICMGAFNNHDVVMCLGPRPPLAT